MPSACPKCEAELVRHDEPLDVIGRPEGAVVGWWTCTNAACSLVFPDAFRKRVA